MTEVEISGLPFAHLNEIDAHTVLELSSQPDEVRCLLRGDLVIVCVYELDSPPEDLKSAPILGYWITRCYVDDLLEKEDEGLFIDLRLAGEEDIKPSLELCYKAINARSTNAAEVCIKLQDGDRAPLEPLSGPRRSAKTTMFAEIVRVDHSGNDGGGNGGVPLSLAA